MIRVVLLALALTGCTVVSATGPGGMTVHACIIGQGNITAGTIGQAPAPYVTAVNYTDTVTIVSALASAAAAYAAGS